jgi:peptidoglycan/LPS O-acetylase OafA/YrhL
MRRSFTPLAAAAPTSLVTRRLDVALIVRGVAAFQVLAWHAGGHAWNGGVARWLNISGTQCVWLFLGLSGYFVSQGFSSGRYTVDRTGDLGAFYLGRAMRILPVYALAAIVTAGLLRVGAFGHQDVDALEKLFATLLFLSPVVTLPTALWAIVVEVYFYIVFPVYLLAARRFGGGLTTTLFIYVGLASVPLLRLMTGGTLDDRTFVGNASHFVAGVLAHDVVRYVNRGRLLERWAAIPAIITVILAALVIPTGFYHGQRGVFWPIGSVLTDVAVTGIIVLHCRAESHAQLPRIVAPFQLAGSMAFGLYVWHSVALAVAPQLFGHIALLIAIALTLSLLSRFALERPILRLRERLTNRAFLG